MTLSPWQAVRLVASREVATRIRSKALIISTALFVVAIVGGGVLFKLIGGPDPAQVGVAPDAGELRTGLVAAAEGAGLDLEVREVEDRAAGTTLVREEELDALLTTGGEGLGVVVAEELEPQLEAVFGALARQRALADAVVELGGEPGEVAEQVAGARPQVEVLEAQDEADPAQLAAGFAVGILIFIGLMTTGQMVAMGVVEEKSSRVVELLLATIRPWQLMAGKVLGIGVVGLLQIGIIVVAAASTAFALDLVSTSRLALGSTAAWALAWFVVGYLLYAVTMAGLAALVSRQEDVGSVLSPVIAVMMVPYMLGVTIAPWEPDNPLVVVLSFVPFSSPMLMPIRTALGAAAGWEAWLSLALSLAVLPLLVWLAGRIYGGAVLHTGGRMRLRRALRAQR